MVATSEIMFMAVLSPTSINVWPDTNCSRHHNTTLVRVTSALILTIFLECLVSLLNCIAVDKVRYNCTVEHYIVHDIITYFLQHER